MINSQAVRVSSDMQVEAVDRWCKYLDRPTGRCGIYAQRPFACDFELIRLLVFKERVVVTQKQYGRAWAMMRLDGARGARCEMLPQDARTVAEVARKLQRLQEWAEHIGIRTCVPSILKWVRKGDGHEPLRLAADHG